MNRRSTTDYGTPTSYRRRTPPRNHHLGPRYRRSLVSATDYSAGSDTPPPGTQQHTCRHQALSRESSPPPPPNAHPHRSQNREANYAHHRRSPPEESTTSGAPHSFSRKGKATSGAHRCRSPLREYDPYCANFRHSSTSEATSGAHTIRPQTVPIQRPQHYKRKTHHPIHMLCYICHMCRPPSIRKLDG